MLTSFNKYTLGIIAVALAVVVNKFRFLDPLSNTLSAIGLTIPSFALVGLLLP